MCSNSMDSISSVPSTCKKELHRIFYKLFKWLLAIIALKNTSIGAALFTTHPKLINASGLAIVLYFLAWLFGTTLQSHVRTSLPILTCIIVPALLIISPLIALLSSPVWVAVFAVIADYCYQQIYEMTCSAIFETIQKMIASYKTKSTMLPI